MSQFQNLSKSLVFFQTLLHLPIDLFCLSFASIDIKYSFSFSAIFFAVSTESIISDGTESIFCCIVLALLAVLLNHLWANTNCSIRFYAQLWFRDIWFNLWIADSKSVPSNLERAALIEADSFCSIELLIKSVNQKLCKKDFLLNEPSLMKEKESAEKP